MEPVYRPIIGLGRTMFAVQGLRFSLEGESNIPRTGGAVLAINHISYLDYAYVGLVARASRRYVRFMAKEEIFANRVGGPLMRGMGHIPVDRDAGMASFRAAVNALKAGEVVGVFPEATISTSFELKEFKSGTVRMAQMAGVPILPTTIWGAQRVWTKGRPRRLGRHRFPISVTVGAPIEVGKGAAAATAANEQLVTTMRAQLDRQQAAYPPLTGDELVYQPARLGGLAPTPEEAAARHTHAEE